MKLPMSSFRGPLGLSSLAGCSGGALAPQDVYALARNAGFAPDTARSMVAIAMRESSLIPNCFADSVAGSKEASYGLWQINMSPGLAASRLALFKLSSPTQLLDPAVNAMAAYRLSGGTNLTPWHIDSDWAVINGVNVNLGYRTKYLNFLAALPPTATMEANYANSGGGTDFNLNGDSITPIGVGVNAPGYSVGSGGDSGYDDTTYRDLTPIGVPPVDDYASSGMPLDFSDPMTIGVILLGAGLVWYALK